jgi:ketosteroid isomerase-like protein
MPTPGETFYKRQVAFLEAKDVQGLVANQYAQDAELVSFDFTVKGHQALKDHFTRYLEGLGDFKHLSTENFVETEDTVFFEATVRIKSGTARVYNAFVLKGGKAIYHFTGRLGFTPEIKNN